jgi:predicted metal-dependent HD superfamily phosphohydrolase
MTACELLSASWCNLAARHHCAIASAQAVLDGLLEAYSEQSRHYHTVEHIASLLRQLDGHRHAVVDRDVLELAILFHDVVYDPRRSDNEEKSAARARDRLVPLGLPGKLVRKVVRYIHATKHDSRFVTEDPDLALLLDLDLSTLAATPAEYRVYAEAIRREYGHVADDQYRAGRRRILEGFLNRDRIYRTGRLHHLLEERARANITRELTELSSHAPGITFES